MNGKDRQSEIRRLQQPKRLLLLTAQTSLVNSLDLHGNHGAILLFFVLVLTGFIYVFYIIIINQIRLVTMELTLFT